MPIPLLSHPSLVILHLSRSLFGDPFLSGLVGVGGQAGSHSGGHSAAGELWQVAGLTRAATSLAGGVAHRPAAVPAPHHAALTSTLKI
jgi:hypothetical protein